MTDLNTEGPTTGQGVAAGGVDKAKEAALAEQGDEATPTSTAVPADTQVQAPSADDVTTSGEPADSEDDSADEAEGQVQAPSADDVTTSGEPADSEDDSADEAEGQDDTIEDEAGDDSADAPDSQESDTDAPTPEAGQ